VVVLSLDLRHHASAMGGVMGAERGTGEGVTIIQKSYDL
jgi:hypothetical protein